jgi:site-specific DNA recombinase
MFAEYEKAQIMERYRRGKAHRAKTGSVNVLSGAPYGYRYLRKTPHAPAGYEIVAHEAVLVREVYRRYTDEGDSIADLARWLTDRAAPTRTGKTRWDRTVVWAMLRNPAYTGQAVYGKTKAVSGPAALNRVARQAGRSTGRAVKTVDRPADEWVHIPVPAIISPETFERAAQRLADNKRFASRNSKAPSLLQGLAACSGCGYAYYRGHTTTSAARKIFYYRCIGSDNYRFEHGRICDNKPVRADYLDQLVWDHITALLSDPSLIQAEIDRRLNAARTADPVVQQRQRIAEALTRATAAVNRMISAYQEELITIDELRTRLPDLRAREASLRSQLQALDAQSADQQIYLKLAHDLDTFLSGLRTTAATSDVHERQRIVRLLIKDVLVGPEKITIRHRIPVREHTPDSGHDTAAADTEGDNRAGSPLRWGRDQPFATERRTPRAGGSRRRTISQNRPAGRDNDAGRPGAGEIRRRFRGVLPIPAAGRTDQGAVGRVAATPGSCHQRGQDPDRAPVRGVRLPGVQHPPLRSQAADQTEHGGHQAAPETARDRDARAARLERGGGPRPAQPDHSGLGRLLPGSGVQQDLLPAGHLHVAAHLQVGQTQPPEQVEDMGGRPLLRQVQQVQQRPMGVRRARDHQRARRRRAPDQVPLDEHRPTPDGQRHGYVG